MSHTSKSTIPMPPTNTLKASKVAMADGTQTDKPSCAYSETYFDALYHKDTDPWHYQTRWYEKRKRDMCLSVLPQAHYDRAIELGSGNGVFSELLADRCEALVSIDGNEQAVQLAKQRLAHASHVRVIKGVIPDTLLTFNKARSRSHTPPFDLIIISEILYYLSPEDIDTVIAWTQQNLARGGTLLCCHWRYPIDGFAMTGETVHQRLHQAFNLVPKGHPQQVTFMHQSQIVDNDFLLDVWQNSENSVAMQENLV